MEYSRVLSEKRGTLKINVVGGILFGLLYFVVGRPQLEDVFFATTGRQGLVHILLFKNIIIASPIRWEPCMVKATHRYDKNYPPLQYPLTSQISIRACLNRPIPIYIFQMIVNKSKSETHIIQRNQKISSILVLLITIYQKIEKLKQKLCGFSPTEFSPESIFEALDLTGKGYLDTYDIHSFLGNDSIRDKDILVLFARLGDQGLGRLTYLGYLTLLKPFFDQELARDLLLRDTVTHRKNRASEDEESLHEMQETVLILLNELILLHCICIAEHEGLKTALIEEYMLNQIEIREILGIGGKVSALTAIHEFIQCNSEYEVDKSEVKYLLALTQTNQTSFSQEKCLNLLFIPTRPIQKKIKKQAQGELNLQDRQTLHSNYTKDYLGKGDLIVTSNKLSFLNYIHPNSFEKPVRDVPFTKPQQKQPTKEEEMEQQHKKFSVSRQKLVNQPFKPGSSKPVAPKPQQMTQSIVQKSNLHQYPPKKPQSSRLQSYSYDRIDTPVLQQFMHESNIKRNMGRYKANNKELQLNVLIEQSGVSDSDGIVRVDYTSKQAKQKIETSNQYPSNYYPLRKPEDYEASRHKGEFIANNSSSQYPNQHFIHQNRSNISNVGDTSGILNQFLKSQFRS